MVRALIIPPGPWGTAGPGPPLRIIPAPAVPRLLRGDARTRLCSGVHFSPILSPCLKPCPLRHPSCCHSCKGGPAPAAPDWNPAGDAGHQLEALLQISVFQQQVGLYRLTFVDLQRQSVAPSMSQWTAWQPLLHIVQDVFVLLHWSRWRASRCAMGENPEVSEKIKWADSRTRRTEFVNVDIQSE